MNVNIKKDPTKSEPLFDQDDLDTFLGITSETESDVPIEPDQLENLLAKTGKAINEAYPMPPIQAPKGLPASDKETARELSLIPFPRRHSMSNGTVGLTVLLGMAASFVMAAFLFGKIPFGKVDSIEAIEKIHQTKTAPPHPEALEQYNQEAADALLERAEHLLVLWQFHKDKWYLEESLRNLLEAKSYQAKDARILDALAEVYMHLNQKEKEAKYREQAKKLRQE